MDQIQDLDLRLVVSSRAQAAGLLRAKRSGLPTLVFPKTGSWEKLHQELVSRRIDSIFLVGFMRILPADFVSLWAGRIWNIHPSLLPAYPGTDSIEKSFVDGAPMGVSLHEVTAGMDEGPLRLQAKIERSPDLPTTQLRIARMEQRLLREWALRPDLSLRGRT